jgi:hypothetical protein
VREDARAVFLKVTASAARRWISPFPRDKRGQPYGQWVLLSTCGEEDFMTVATARPVHPPADQFARLWWLPGGGCSNGLGASRAEATLLAEMPSLAREAADRADSAWR